MERRSSAACREPALKEPDIVAPARRKHHLGRQISARVLHRTFAPYRKNRLFKARYSSTRLGL